MKHAQYSDGRLVVAVLLGGRSVEHEISVITGLQVLEALDAERFTSLPVYVAQDGQWYSGDALRKRSFYEQLPGSLSMAETVRFEPQPGRRGGLVGSKGEMRGVDVYLLALHGSIGEDGCIQGLLEMAEVPYTGCGVAASAIGMNKYLCKRLVGSDGIPVLPGHVVHRRELRSGLAGIHARLKASRVGAYPLFVKPCNLGSSVGIGVAADSDALNAALLKVFELDVQALVEPCVAAPFEINISVMRSRAGVRTSVVEVPVVSRAGAMLTYEEKYVREGGKKGRSAAVGGMADAVRAIDPVDLPASVKEAASTYAIRIYELLGCEGVARIDFMWREAEGGLFFNEINTLPGSLAFYLWAESPGYPLLTEVLNDLIEQALARRQEAAALSRDHGFKVLKRRS